MYVRGLTVPTTCADEEDDGGSGAGVSLKRLSASRDDTIDGNCAAGFFLSSLGFSDVGDGAQTIKVQSKDVVIYVCLMRSRSCRRPQIR